MSPPRNRSSSAADATAGIAQRAWQTTVASAVLVPTLQLILLRLAEAMHPVTDTTFAGDPMTILYTAIFVLGIFPIVSTLVSTAVAYVAAGFPGVILYYMVSVGASMMLGAELTGAIIFLTGTLLFLIAATVKSRNKQRRPPRAI